jgi:hypothetical protein
VIAVARRAIGVELSLRRRAFPSATFSQSNDMREVGARERTACGESRTRDLPQELKWQQRQMDGAIGIVAALEGVVASNVGVNRWQ